MYYCTHLRNPQESLDHSENLDNWFPTLTAMRINGKPNDIGAQNNLSEPN